MSLFSDMQSRAVESHLRTMGVGILFIPARGAQRTISAVPLIRNGHFVDGTLHETQDTTLQLTAVKSSTTGLDDLVKGDSVRYVGHIWSFQQLLSDDGAALVGSFTLNKLVTLGTKPSQL